MPIHVPRFDAPKIRKDIFELVEIAPTRDMYSIVMQSIDKAMDNLVEIREEISTDDDDIRKMLRAWDEVFSEFGEREAHYYQQFLEGEDRKVVDKPLFKGDYEDFQFEDAPTWPDIETPWRLANELATAAVASGADQDFLNSLEGRFKFIISNFWESANALIVEQKTRFEDQAIAEASDAEQGSGRVYGFWPVVAVGAVALVGLFGTAAGYTAAKSGKADEYVKMSPFEEHLKTAKKVGLGILIGAVIAIVLMWRSRR